MIWYAMKGYDDCCVENGLKKKRAEEGDCLGCYHIHPGQRWWFDYAGNSRDRIFACEIAFESESLKSDEKKMGPESKQTVEIKHDS